MTTAAAYERYLGPEARAIDYYEAQEDLLADIDSFVEWLQEECIGHADVRTGYVPFEPVALLLHTDECTVPQLVALQHYPKAEVSFAATEAIKGRYLAAKQAAVRAKALRLAGERE